jgi:hypothetical protein
MDSLTSWGIERSMRLVEEGVLIIGLDSDANVLHRAYSDALSQVRGG